MWITAEDLDGWAARPEARTEFPALVRRLIAHSGARLRRLDMPSGSGADLPGWDGVVEAAEGNAWTPAGASQWELSSEQDVARKARADLDKRTNETNPEERTRLAFVFTTPRKWPGKAKWQKGAEGRGWREVRAYDAHDLVQWLDSAPAVALWLAEQLGKAGPGVETVDRFFARWSAGSDPALTARALATGRFRAARQLRRLLNDPKSPITIRADSEEEAAAFVASVLQRNPSLAARAAVVTAASGWHWVERNPDLRFVLCASSELARGAPVRDGLIVLVPHARGDVSPFENREKSEATGPQLPLPRPDALLFARSLEKLGIEEPKAWALARRCGRSWSAFRRLQAVSPALRTPPWSERPESRALSVLALFGAFSNRDADRALVEEVAGRPWEEIERDLRILADLPDPPVLTVGGAWKAKAIAELFLAMAPRITAGEVERFFAVARAVLTGPPEYGPFRVLARFVADALPRLAVLGPGSLAAEPEVEGRVRRLVHDLLHEANADRWRSLSRHLPALAEAAPDVFLDAVEAALGTEPSPLGSLFPSSPEAPRSDFAQLLWALEILGRDPTHLLRVSEILAALVPFAVHNRMRNDPRNCLLGLFRPWFPQTNASLEERLEVLATLTARYPEPAFELLLGMLPGHDTASEHARPAWRDTWLRPVRVTGQDGRRAVESAADRAIALAEGNPDRLARLVEQLDGLRAAGREAAALAALDAYARTNPPDQARQKLRRALCDRFHFEELHWKKPFPFRPSALPLARLWRALAPRNPVLRHLHLFGSGGFTLPGAPSAEATHRILAQRQARAVQEVFRTMGSAGLQRLAEAAGVPKWVGAAVWRAGLQVDLEALVAGALEVESAHSEAAAKMLEGWLAQARGSGRLQAALDALLEAARNRRLDAVAIGRLLALAPFLPSVWDLAAREGREAELAYWSRAEPWPQELAAQERERAMGSLIAVGRAADALERLVTPEDPVPAYLLLEALTKLAAEAGKQRTIDSGLDYRIFLALGHLEADPSIDRDRLAERELALLPALENLFSASPDRYRSHCTSLWRRLTTDADWFVELLRRRTDRRAVENNVFAALSHCPRLPGQRDDGTVDGAALTAFVDHVLERTRGTDLECHASRALAQLLVRTPADPDGRWPCEPVAALLDREDLEMVRDEFPTEYCNAQDLLEIGAAAREDREKAERFGLSARAYSNCYPRVAALLHALARVLMSHSNSWEDDLKRQTEGLY